ncbi:origin recognition complex subunit 2-like isoform X2 [Gigantopelta aegis]|uniref:origin recognition complex subunit 2-like isoform X2 n=1 Tax=Gigantopelta aegis TaxID=1735272 RepID=UPI001B88C326|nr:origin recognition complex subunit 2-like isoform X2 [Gigantopelta aegis]
MRSARKSSSVSVTFAGDDDVVKHIISQESKTHARHYRETLTYSTKTCSPKSKKGDVVEDSSDEDDPVMGQSEALAVSGVGDGVFLGCDVFKFKTPKKSGMMALKADECRTPTRRHTRETTPSKSVSKSKTASGKKVKTSQVSEPKSKQQEETSPLRRSQRRPETTTPYRLRKRNASDDELSDSDEDSTDSESDEESNTPQTPSRRKKPVKDFEDTTNAEDYFDLHSGTGRTSENTLSKLKTPKMEQESLNKLLRNVATGHKKEFQELLLENTALFPNWMYHMCGFNILLYGLGSKRGFLEEFRKTFLRDYSHVVVNGYFPSLTIKHIFGCIIDEILECDGSHRNPADQYELIRKHFEEGYYEDFFLILHNIDGATLRGEKTQNLLSLLASIRGIHIIASVDHINAPLVWDNAKCSRFNWVWYDVTNFTPYTSETSYENSLLVQQTGALALSSLTHVMRSLTPNAKGIFMLLVRYQLENKDNPLYIGMSFTDLYQRCGEAFLVNSDLTLRAQLTEFRDHKLVKSKKSYDGAEHLNIPIDTTTLIEFVEQHENS